MKELKKNRFPSMNRRSFIWRCVAGVWSLVLVKSWTRSASAEDVVPRPALSLDSLNDFFQRLGREKSDMVASSLQAARRDLRQFVTDRFALQPTQVACVRSTHSKHVAEFDELFRRMEADLNAQGRITSPLAFVDPNIDEYIRIKGYGMMIKTMSKAR